MEKVSKEEMSLIVGGGYWMLLPDGFRIYVEDDEEGDDDDIIYGC